MPDRPLPDRPLPESPPIDSPDGATPPSAWDETLMRAIDAGQLDASQAADAKLAGAFAAHQKLESLFAALRGQPDADPDAQPEPAPTQLGRYVIGAGAGSPDAAILGAGAFGIVYLAHDPELNREVAIKVSSLSLGKTARARADAIATEARHAASLNHPGIVTIHDVGRDGERLFIVMQYIRGQTLEQLLRAGPVAPARAAELLAAVADALHYAHKRGFVHRDLKPANILLDEQGGPHVADFGLAVSEETQRALGGQVAGTPEYMAPEQIRGESHRLDGRTDVWALGVILYELLAGRRPFAGQTTRVVLDEIEHRDPKPPRQINDAIPAELERICLKCLAKRMTDRYATAADLAADLRDFRSRRNLPALSAESGRGGESNLLPRPSGEGRGEGVPARRQTSPPPPPAVIPQGLRAFDAHDADFFLQLLPGPKDRDGLPESLRFWKTRVEQTDADATFAVGLIYGPSGCGKSSLVKAGLLPRLAPHVLPVYLEATADDTEGRLLKALRKRSPELTARDLVGAIAELRAGDGLAAGHKLLIVLDQFEQWLHAHRDPQPTELVRAVRQCDGARVQCVVTVRDDFWLSASRFMQALEIPLVERENSALVDLFDPLHARKVLALFGGAYGRLPAQGELSAEQSRFIEQAVAELAEAGKVVSVRLALFAEMVKGKPWTPATLKDTGGIAGVGVTFLEEAFSATTSAPRHRLHQKAAQAVLKALLPDAGTDLKGHRRSRDELLSISGYTHRPAEFAELLRILDAELRLVTPADEEPARDDPSIQNAKSNSQPSYQLTHDYLVPSLRDWLTRKQRETRRGRAELRLAERAAAYAAAPDSRHLPGWWEWPNILFFTRRRAWSEAERRVMRAAGRRRGLQAALVAVLLVAGTLAGGEARRRVNEDRDRLKADGIVQRLLEAPLDSVPADAAELQPHRHWTDAKLRQVLADDSNSNAGQRLRASIGLLDVDAEQAKPVYEAMLNASPEDARVLVGILKPHGSEFVERLWQLVANRDASASSRLRAAMALAAFTPANAEEGRWPTAAPFIVDQILTEARQDPSQYEPLVAGLAPAAEALLPALGAVFRDSARNSTERELATSVAAKYAAGDPRALVDFINDAQPEQFSIIFPALERHGDAAIGLLAAELDKHATFNWHDPPLDPLWQPPAASTLARIEAAGGMLAERFALVQTLPLNDFSDLADELRASGYRPLRCRPYPAGDHIQVAGVWTRDVDDWKSAVGLQADEVLARNRECEKEAYIPVDVAGYSTNEGVRFTALWSRGGVDTGDRRLYVDLSNLTLPDADVAEKLPATLHAYYEPGGSQRYASIWRRGTRFIGYLWSADASTRDYDSATPADLLQLDVALLLGPSPSRKSLDFLRPLVGESNISERYAWLFETNPTYVSLSLHGLAPDMHVRRCRDLANKGYRPAAITVAQANDSQNRTEREADAPSREIAASVWRLPRVDDGEKERLAQRQANAATALVRLGHAHRVWPLLCHSPDPRLRSWIVRQTGPLGVEPRLLIDRLFGDVAQPLPRDLAPRPASAALIDEVLFNPETSIRRALILALGDFDERQLAASAREALVEKLLEIYRSDPDAGLHAAAGWLVQHWGSAHKLVQLNDGLRGDNAPSDGRRWFINSQGQTMVVIPGPVEFLTGSPADETGREGWEPLQRQRIARSFAICANEVTVGQIKSWQPLFRYSQRYSPSGDCPINGVCWYDAAAYCNWLSEQEGLSPCYEPNSKGEYADGMRPASDYLSRDGYRLPTEAEWEFACRAGATTSRYYGASEQMLVSYACEQDNAKDRMFPTGSLKPNDLGLFDILGNALEWTGDRFAMPRAPWRVDSPRNDIGDLSALSDKGSRVLRGGAFAANPSSVRCANRVEQWPTFRSSFTGFRVARTLPTGMRPATTPASNGAEER